MSAGIVTVYCEKSNFVKCSPVVGSIPISVITGEYFFPLYLQPQSPSLLWSRSIIPLSTLLMIMVGNLTSAVAPAIAVPGINILPSILLVKVVSLLSNVHFAPVVNVCP